MDPSSEPKRARVGHSDHFIAENLSLKLTSPELYEVNHNDLKRAFQASAYPFTVRYKPLNDRWWARLRSFWPTSYSSDEVNFELLIS